MPPRIHLVRHGEGEHNVDPTSENRQIRDPALTPAAVSRCLEFHKIFPDYEQHIDLVCASPMRRTIQTAQYCFKDIIATTPSRTLLLLPLAQEVTDQPCDIGSSPGEIEAEFGDLVDVSLMEEPWTSKQGIYAATLEGLETRARVLRRWLFEREENDVLIVGHGAFFDYLLHGPDVGHVLDPGVFAIDHW